MSKVGRCFIFLRIDDLLIFIANDPLQALVDKILTTFEGRDMKELSYVLSLGVCENRDGWLVAWGLCGCMLIRFSAVWLLPFTLL